MKYKAYSEYKDSGVEWLGDIPKPWRVAGFKKHIESIVDYRGKTPEKTDNGILLVTARNIKNGFLDYSLSQEFIAIDDYENVMSRGKPNIGDVLFTTEAPLGEVANVDKTNIALAQRVIKFCGKKGALDNFYFKYLIMSQEFQQSLSLFASGSTVKGIKAERFVYLRNILPSIEEQKHIAKFLDHETAKIDTLIEKQQQLIKLLKEKRQAVISHAVTKGLNPDAPMKNFGIEWLGDVPAHWEVKKIAWNFTAQKGVNGQLLTKEYCGLHSGAYPVYSGQTENHGIMGKVDSYEFDTGKEGVLFSTTVGAKAMTLSHLTGKFSLSQNCMIIIATTSCYYTRFCYYHFQPLFAFERGLIPDHMQASFRMEDLYQYKVSLPPLSEQKQIAEFLDQKTAQIDKLVSKAEQAIELIKERRTALISAAVTGKVDVRDWKEKV